MSATIIIPARYESSRYPGKPLAIVAGRHAILWTLDAAYDVPHLGGDIYVATNDERIAEVAKLARGYVYYVSLKGVTGAGNLDLTAIAEKMPQLRKHIKLPIGVGFGIRDAATARAVSKLCDGVVVGSRIVQEVEDSNEQNVVANVGRLVQELRVAIDNEKE